MMKSAIVFGSLLWAMQLVGGTAKVDLLMRYHDVIIQESYLVEADTVVKSKHFPITISLRNSEADNGDTLLSAKIYAEVNGHKKLIASPVLLINKESAGTLVLGDAIKDNSVYLEINASIV